jgi:hypothetical protein
VGVRKRQSWQQSHRHARRSAADMDAARRCDCGIGLHGLQHPHVLAESDTRPNQPPTSTSNPLATRGPGTRMAPGDLRTWPLMVWAFASPSAPGTDTWIPNVVALRARKMAGKTLSYSNYQTAQSRLRDLEPKRFRSGLPPECLPLPDSSTLTGGRVRRAQNQCAAPSALT